ncbi:MAG: MFS transporter [Candidatus Bathycorpusculaceae bacterium]
MGGVEFVGLSLSLAAAMSIPLFMTCGILADVFGKKPIILAAAAAKVLGLTMLSLLPNHLAFLVAVILINGISIIAGSVISALLIDLVSIEFRGTAFSLVFASSLASSAFGSIVLGHSLELLGSKVTLGLCLLLAVVGFLFRFKIHEIRQAFTERKIVHKNLRGKITNALIALKDKTVFFLALITIVVAFSVNLDGPYYPIYMNSNLRMSEALISIVFL